MALTDNVILGWFGSGGGAKLACGTAVVGDTVETRLSRVNAVILTYNVDEAADAEPLAATGLNTTNGHGSFLVDGEAAGTLYWLAIGV